MLIKAHMIVTISANVQDSKHNHIILRQMEEWVKQLRELPDNLDKIGNFLYHGDDEPEHGYYDNVKFLLEIQNDD